MLSDRAATGSGTGFVNCIFALLSGEIASDDGMGVGQFCISRNTLLEALS
jgi:hypothetical protein